MTRLDEIEAILSDPMRQANLSTTMLADLRALVEVARAMAKMDEPAFLRTDGKIGCAHCGLLEDGHLDACPWKQGRAALDRLEAGQW